jgi:hypothetical protein
MEIMLGADPEIFAKKGNEFVCAWGLIPGNKKNPHKVKRGAVQVDGFALEFNIDPVKTEEDFVVSIHEVLQQLYAMVPGYEVVAVPTAPFAMEYIKAQPKEAQELGCDPDFNAWEAGMEFAKPDGSCAFRTGAGHIHVGWTKNADIHDPAHTLMCCDLVRQLDFYLGLPSVVLDKDKQRRSLYGKAGCFRPKPYGVEYRTLSNFWLNDDKLIRLIYHNTHLAVQKTIEGEFLFEMMDIQEIINESDVHQAEGLCQIFNIPLEV